MIYPKFLKLFFLITDSGFILYWFITICHLLPPEYLFRDYYNPILVAWNWSFLPLDLLISLTGFLSLYFIKNKKKSKKLALISLVLTFCSGLQAITFWIIREDFDLTWWLPNLFLLIYPLFFIPYLINDKS